MGKAKDIVLKPISSRVARALVRRLHYSGKVANNSQLHIGVYYNGKLEGAMQFGPSLDKRKIQGLVTGTKWHEFMELNRMAFSDALPRNSESRAIAIAMKLLKKHAPQVKWIVSFADATQCGDGTIYRASGFLLTGIKESVDLWRLPDSLAYLSTGGQSIHRVTIGCKTSLASKWCLKKYGTHNIPVKKLAAENGGSVNVGFQLRYIYFIDKSCQQNLTVPILPFSAIDEAGARMYKGVKLDAPLVNGDNVATSHAGRFDPDPEA